MDSDDINSISDTEEALQITTIVEETYNELMTRKEWNHLKIPRQLESLSDADYPSTLKIPEDVMQIDTVRYDVTRDSADPVEYQTIKYKHPNDFLDYILTRRSPSSEIDSLTVKGSGVPLLVYNDRPPTFWTSFDDQFITFDSYNINVEDTVRGNKSIVYAVVLPEFNKNSDEFIPEMPARMFPLFLAECKKACFFYLKDSQSPVDEKRTFRGAAIFNDRGNRAHDRARRARFGRK